MILSSKEINTISVVAKQGMLPESVKAEFVTRQLRGDALRVAMEVIRPAGDYEAAAIASDFKNWVAQNQRWGVGDRVRTRAKLHGMRRRGVVSRRDGSYVYVYLKYAKAEFEFYDCELEGYR